MRRPLISHLSPAPDEHLAARAHAADRRGRDRVAAAAVASDDDHHRRGRVAAAAARAGVVLLYPDGRRRGACHRHAAERRSWLAVQDTALMCGKLARIALRKRSQGGGEEPGAKRRLGAAANLAAAAAPTAAAARADEIAPGTPTVVVASKWDCGRRGVVRTFKEPAGRSAVALDATVSTNGPELRSFKRENVRRQTEAERVPQRPAATRRRCSTSRQAASPRALGASFEPTGHHSHYPARTAHAHVPASSDTPGIYSALAAHPTDWPEGGLAENHGRNSRFPTERTKKGRPTTRKPTKGPPGASLFPVLLRRNRPNTQQKTCGIWRKAVLLRE